MPSNTAHNTPTFEINDAHCHFFSEGFFEKLLCELLSNEKNSPTINSRQALFDELEWDAPGSVHALADRWIEELDDANVTRIALMSSVPEDELSVAEAIERHPRRFVGMFMVNPLATDANERVRRAFSEYHMNCACLFPAMHHYSLDDKAVKDIFELAAHYERATFIHCGVLSIGVRKKLGLRSTFDIQRGNPLKLVPLASQFPTVPVIVPHFGAGFFRELLMASDVCPNIYTDTSSSNSWITLMPNLSLVDVFRSTLNVLGPKRILFGTDSSFFPRGWQKPLFDTQQKIFDTLELTPSHRDTILNKNFNRIFRVNG
tara:strand:+ start:6747 stop:7697 length:951 start_codon:yes stop_codon:yes gene_type:complete